MSTDCGPTGPSAMGEPAASERPAAVRFGKAFRFWLKLGFISIDGPAGLIAIMHGELADFTQPTWMSQ
ncbi:MAG: hypothetical protein NDI88_15095 [Lysobacter sp.]|nr:hypothetical protein [Lysobacter sp.]